jgi:hypothetical protein
MQLLKGFGIAALAPALLLAAPAMAQTEADIDALIDGSATPEAALALAHTQAHDGDLLGAAATLERALLTNPRAATVRLYYAGILCRLGDGQTARVELAKVDGSAVTDAAWDETRTACGDVERPAARHGSGGLRGEVSAGLTYDSDLAGSLLVVSNIPGAVTNDDGLSFVGSARLSGRAPIGSAFFYGDAGALSRTSVSGAKADYQAGDITLGLGAPIGGNAEISFGGIARHFRIAGDPFLTDLGGEIELALLLGDGRLTLRGEVVQEEYNGSTAIFSRDGMHYDAGLSYAGGRRTAYWLGAAYEGKDAQTRRTGYSGARAYAGIRQLLTAGGAYGSLGGTVRYVEYRDELGFQPVNELRWFGRAALGMPLARSLDVEAAANYTRRDYNPASGFKDYESVGGELRLVWNFGQ